MTKRLTLVAGVFERFCSAKDTEAILAALGYSFKWKRFVSCSNLATFGDLIPEQLLRNGLSSKFFLFWNAAVLSDLFLSERFPPERFLSKPFLSASSFSELNTTLENRIHERANVCSQRRRDLDQSISVSGGALFSCSYAWSVTLNQRICQCSAAEESPSVPCEAAASDPWFQSQIAYLSQQSQPRRSSFGGRRSAVAVFLNPWARCFATFLTFPT